MKKILNFILGILVLITVVILYQYSSESVVSKDVQIKSNQYAARVPVPVTKPPK